MQDPAQPSPVQPSHPPAPFVVGVPRSGTTLLRLMLDAHPDLAIPSETHFLPALAGLQGSDSQQREQFFQLVTTFNTWQDLGLEASAVGRALEALNPFSVGDGLRAFYGLYARKQGKRRWGDKTPLYGNHLPLIRALLPEARFIHVLRDGRDVAVSVRPLWFAPGGDLASLARDWHDTVKHIRADGRALGGYAEVRYEHLLENPDRELRRLCEFLALPFSPSMLTYHQTAGARLGEMGDYRRQTGEWVPRSERLAWHSWTSRPPARERAGRWRRELTGKEQVDFHREAGTLLRELGYET